jgi:hypothetical protein
MMEERKGRAAKRVKGQTDQSGLVAASVTHETTSISDPPALKAQADAPQTPKASGPSGPALEQAMADCELLRRLFDRPEAVVHSASRVLLVTTTAERLQRVGFKGLCLATLEDLLNAMESWYTSSSRYEAAKSIAQHAGQLRQLCSVANVALVLPPANSRSDASSQRATSIEVNPDRFIASTDQGDVINGAAIAEPPLSSIDTEPSAKHLGDSPCDGFPSTSTSRSETSSLRDLPKHDDKPQLCIKGLVVDENTFSVKWKDRRAEMGNRKEFRLLLELAKSEGRFVTYRDLADRLGGGQLDDIRHVKSRLVKQLRQHKLDELANRVRTEPGHYGLFLP